MANIKTLSASVAI